MFAPGRVLAWLGAAALLVSAFLPWTANDLAAIDLGLRSWGDELNQPTVGLALVVLAAVPAVTALVGDRGWPRAVAALGVGALVVAWLAQGPDGELTSGVAWSIGGAAALLLSSALGSGPERATAGPAPARADPAPVARPSAPPSPPAPWPRPERRTIDPDGSGRDRGHQVVPFAPRPTVEAWGPTRAACLSEALLGGVSTFLDITRLQADAQVAVRVDEDEPEQALVVLFRQTLGALPETGRVPVEADLFDGADGGVLGFVATAALPAELNPATAATAPVDVEVTRSGESWRCRVTLAS